MSAIWRSCPTAPAISAAATAHPGGAGSGPRGSPHERVNGARDDDPRRRLERRRRLRVGQREDPVREMDINPGRLDGNSQAPVLSRGAI